MENIIKKNIKEIFLLTYGITLTKELRLKWEKEKKILTIK